MKLLVFLLLLAAACDAPKAPPIAGAPDPYPLRVGCKWTYEAAKVPLVVREVVQADGPWFKMRYALPILGDRELMMRRDGNIVIGRGDGGATCTLLKFPMKVGDRWTIDLAGVDRIADCEVVEPEEVDLPIGKFRADKLKVVWRTRGSDSSTTDFEWYVTGYGLVQMQTTLARVTAVFKLKRFEG